MSRRPRRSKAQDVAFDTIITQRRALGEVIFKVACDGKGCSTLFEGTHRQRRAAHWAVAWRRKKGIEIQIDLCPKCREGWPKGKRP